MDTTTPRVRAFLPIGKGRILQLDILRGFAVMLVLWRHTFVLPGETHFLAPLAARLHTGGWTGVDLFFVLSGFLIGGQVFKELQQTQHLNVGRFLIRRGFKIWPTYYIFLAYLAFFPLYALARHGTGSVSAVYTLLAPNLYHIQNYLGSWRGHTWSLAVEEHFYLLLPFLLMWLSRRVKGQNRTRIAYFPAVAVGVTLFCTLGRCFNAWHSSSYRAMWMQNYGWTHLRLDGLFFGVLLAYLYQYRPEFLDTAKRFRRALFVGGVLLVAPMLFLDVQEAAFVGTIGFNFLALGYGAIMIAMLATPLDEGLAGRIMRSSLMRAIALVGFFSYPIYVWHLDGVIPYFWVAARHWKGHVQGDLWWIFMSGSHLLLAAAQGIVFSLLFETPLLALRDRLFPKRGAAQAVVTTRAGQEIKQESGV